MVERGRTVRWWFIHAHSGSYVPVSTPGDWTTARDRLDELITADPEDPRPLNQMGWVQLDGFKDPTSAAKYWRESLARDDRQPAIRKALAELIQPREGSE
jgi:predicted Zn-dependent protease